MEEKKDCDKIEARKVRWSTSLIVTLLRPITDSSSVFDSNYSSRSDRHRSDSKPEHRQPSSPILNMLAKACKKGTTSLILGVVGSHRNSPDFPCRLIRGEDARREFVPLDRVGIGSWVDVVQRQARCSRATAPTADVLSLVLSFFSLRNSHPSSRSRHKHGQNYDSERWEDR